MWPLRCFRFTYEIAPVFVLLEYVTLKKMREIIGWPGGSGDGIFSPGIWYFNLSSYFSSGLSCLIMNISSVQSLSHVRLFATPWTAESQASCPLLTPGACLNSWPLSRWCHPTISSPVVPFPSCLQCFPASGSILMSWFFASGAQSIGASASASILPMNIQDWFPLRRTDWTSLQSKGLSRVFSNTTAQKHQLFSVQLSLYYEHRND